MEISFCEFVRKILISTCKSKSQRANKISKMTLSVGRMERERELGSLVAYEI
jgi:hypothetical protein